MTRTAPHRPVRHFLRLLVLAGLLPVGGVLAAGASGAAAQPVDVQQQTSQNWSGYVVSSASGQSFSSVSGSWVQPTVNSSSGGSGYSAYWVGLGGSSQQTQSLEQVGTGADVQNGQTSYYAWYELVPAAQQRLSLAVQPGDHMSGSVAVTGTTVTVSLSDQTSGQSVTKTLQMSSPDTSSAEWVVEAPAAQGADGSATILPLADFGNATFTASEATAGGHTGSISDPGWNVRRVDMNSANSGPVLGGSRRFDPAGLGAGADSTAGASTGSLSGDGTSFTVSYSAAGPAQPVSGDTGTGGGYGSGSGDPGYGYPGSGYGYGDPGGSGYGYGDPGGSASGYDGAGYGYDGGSGYGSYGYGASGYGQYSYGDPLG